MPSTPKTTNQARRVENVKGRHAGQRWCGAEGKGRLGGPTGRGCKATEQKEARGRRKRVP